MKNRRFLILIGILGVIAIVVYMNFHRFKFALNMVSLYKNKSINHENEINDEEVKDIVENPLSKVTEIEEPVDNDGDDSQIVEETTPSSEEDRQNKLSLKTIANKYNEELESIQNEFLKELNELISSGYEEYKSGEVSTTKLATKYINEGANLEKICDKKVYATIDKMKKELKDNGHDTSLANEVEEYYEAFKQREKEKLFNKALGKM